MYLSDSDGKKAFRSMLTYLKLTLFCGFFSLIYERFSHGVYSDFMVYLFLFPLLGGGVPYGAVALLKAPYPGRVSRNLYNSGIAALTAGGCLSGVLEIYGTTSPYMPVYWISGTLLAVLGSVYYLRSARYAGGRG